MKKLLGLLKYEAKTIFRDPLNFYMCLFPLIILVLSGYVFPKIFGSLDLMQEVMLKAATMLFLIVILAFSSFFIGAMATFLLLEHKDENTLKSIAVTPGGVSGYLKFKMTYIYFMSVIGIIVILVGTKLIAGDKYVIMGYSLFDRIELSHMIAFALVNGLFTPALGLLQAAVAKNKVEGFAMIKGTGILALVPALMVLQSFQGRLQYLLGVFPNFWALRGMYVEFMPFEGTANLSFPLYLLIGALYNILVLILAYRLYLKKAEY